MIVILASMEDEIQFREQLTFSHKERTPLSVFDIYTLVSENSSGQETAEAIAVGVCGMGKVNAARMTADAIASLTPKPSLIVNIGTAGSLRREVAARDIVVATETLQHDYDLSPFGIEKAFIPNANTDVFYPEGSFLSAAASAGPGSLRVHFGRILTGDQIIASDEQKDALSREFGGLACDMESGAIAQVCHLAKVPFGILRGISDSSEEDMHQQFTENIGSVSENNAMLLMQILKTITETDMA